MSNAHRILVVAADPQLLESVTEPLRSNQFRVALAYDQVEAVEMLQRELPDLVILDVEMAAGNGSRVCKLMAKDPEWSRAPIIVLSNNRDRKTIRRCGQMCAYIVGKRGDLAGRLETVLQELLLAEDAIVQSSRHSNSDVLDRPEKCEDHRTWKDGNGLHLFTAKFVSFHPAGLAELVTVNGETVRVEVVRLSRDDQEYVVRQMGFPIDAAADERV